MDLPETLSTNSKLSSFSKQEQYLPATGLGVMQDTVQNDRVAEIWLEDTVQEMNSRRIQREVRRDKAREIVARCPCLL